MKIVVDTNVIFSGLFFAGLPGKILEDILNGVYQIVLSEEIVSEYRNVIVRYGKKKKVEDLSPALEPVQNLFSSNAKNASTTICKLVLIFLSQFFHKRRHFSSQAKERSTTQRFGSTTNLCNSFRLTTSTFELMIPCTLDANFSPL
jgi:putative PIN family toxin of toxin-antitoxin system